MEGLGRTYLRIGGLPSQAMVTRAMVVLAGVTMVEIEHKEDRPDKVDCYNSTAAQQARLTLELCG